MELRNFDATRAWLGRIDEFRCRGPSRLHLAAPAELLAASKAAVANRTYRGCVWLVRRSAHQRQARGEELYGTKGWLGFFLRRVSWPKSPAWHRDAAEELHRRGSAHAHTTRRYLSYRPMTTSWRQGASGRTSWRNGFRLRRRLTRPNRRTMRSGWHCACLPLAALLRTRDLGLEQAAGFHGRHRRQPNEPERLDAARDESRLPGDRAAGEDLDSRRPASSGTRHRHCVHDGECDGNRLR